MRLRPRAPSLIPIVEIPPSAASDYFLAAGFLCLTVGFYFLWGFGAALVLTGLVSLGVALRLRYLNFKNKEP